MVDSPDQTPTLAEFIDCCHRECNFLVTEYGFEQLDSPMEYNEYSVRFAKGELEVRVYGENYGMNASCDLVRGKDDLYLFLLNPAPEGQTKKPRRRARPGQLAQIQGIAAFLRLHASDFLSGDLRRFDSALAEWTRLTRPRQLTEAERLERQRQQAVAEAGHARKRGDYAQVVKLLEPYAGALSPHQRQMLEMARDEVKKDTDT